MRTFKFSLLVSEATHHATTIGMPLDAFLANFTRYQERETKSGGAWSPIVWRDNIRAKENFEAACALVYDLDWDERLDREALLEALDARLKGLGVTFALHETYTADRYRLVIPLAEDLTEFDYSEAWASSLDLLGLAGTVDDKAKDLARLFYLPAHPPGEERAAGISHGTLFSYTPENRTLDFGGIRGGPELQRALSGKLRIPVGNRHDVMYKLIADLTRNNLELAQDWAKAWPVIESILLRCCDGASAEWVQAAEDDCKRSWQGLGKGAAASILAKGFLETLPMATSPSDWANELITSKDGGIKPMASNVSLVLLNHDAFKGFIQFNELTRRPEISGGALYTHGPDGRNILEGSLDYSLMTWLEKHFQVTVNQRTCGAAILDAAKRNSYNPVRDYLTSLTWDQKPRIANALRTHCKCTGNDKYIAQVSEKFFVASVARALSPGCKVDTVLVLRGNQGTGKTSLIEALAGEWYTTCSGRIDNKDTIIQATESWFVELSELSSMSKVSVEQMRGFITLREDRIRIPYATFHEGFPRRCVFVGTTNDERPLIDSEGNRRFWVVEAGDIDLAAIRRDRDQFFAEAVVKLRAFQDGDERYRWWFTPEEQVVSDAENELFLAEDVLQATINDWTLYELDRPETMTVVQVIKNVCKLQPERVMNERGIMRRVRTCLRKAKWEEKRIRGGPRGDVVTWIPPPIERR